MLLQLTQAADLGVGHGGDGDLLQAAGLAAPRAEGPPPGHHRLNTTLATNIVISDAM